MLVMHADYKWREALIRFALIFMCFAFWRGGLQVIAFSLLVLAWVLDGGIDRFKQVLREPLAQAILLLCIVLLVGLSWSEYSLQGRIKWLKYFFLLLFIPFYSLLNPARLPWVLGSLLASYGAVLGLGIYQWQALDVQGIPALGMSYLSFSAILGAGVVVSIGMACTVRVAWARGMLWLLAGALLFIQFHQGGRVLLLATLAALLLMALLRHSLDTRKLIAMVVSVLVAAVVFAYSSPVFKERFMLIKQDIALLQQGNFSSSMGYRLAMWDVGLHGIAERPLLGYGTGMAQVYFDRTIQTYKGGIYRELPNFQETSHFHNDWIEIGMHTGILGMSCLGFLYWAWYQSLRRRQLQIFAAGMLCYIFIAGLTDTFLVFSKAPLLLLMITAIALHWQPLNQQNHHKAG